MDKILVLDFGSQTTALIGKHIRELGVYCEVIRGDTPLSEEILGKNGGRDSGGYTVRGIVLSGSSASVSASDGPAPDLAIYTCGLPLLGIGYGIRRMTHDNGGLVEPLIEREYDNVEISGCFPDDGCKAAKPFFAAFDPSVSLEELKKGSAVSQAEKWFLNTWVSHGDTITRPAPGFKQFGNTKNGFPAVLAHESKPWFGLIFHPEVNNCERGLEILSAFVYGVSRCSPYWSMEFYAEETCISIAGKVEKNPVLLLMSGGVDSTVLSSLLLKALDPEQVHLMYLDNGLMREDEARDAKTTMVNLGAKNIHIIHCERDFLLALRGVETPEEKRKAIGDAFIKVQERETARLGLQNAFLAQTTIYPDHIDSGKGKPNLIKSYHNVNNPPAEAKREAGLILEPLKKLYKAEVRELGRFLGVGEEVALRHPFPGPGLAVRILGEVTQEKCEILREADAIFIDELKKRKGKAGSSLYDEIRQAFAVLLPIQSARITGGMRRYGWVLSLRAIVSIDPITAAVYPFEAKDLLEISSLITDNVKEIGRVTFDISSKPPTTIEWE
jgi:GMP synthase (glutamine-hydrolysing)